MKQQVLKVNPNDNVIVALTDLPQGTVINQDEKTYILTDTVPAKHKFAAQDFWRKTATGDLLRNLDKEVFDNWLLEMK